MSLPKTAAFLKSIDFILPHETEYDKGHYGDENHVRTENVSGDRGGVTRYGIDQRSHPGVNVASLTRDQAVEIYNQEWYNHRLDLLPERLAIAAFDVYVNGGYPIRWLQEAYNQTHPGEDLVTDNIAGPKTYKALHAGNHDAILRVFLEQRDARFNKLALSPSLSKFRKGWLQRTKDLAKFLNVYFPV